MEARPLLPEEIKELQAILVEAGYKIGGVDGVPGPLTRDAVLRFQQENGMLADGYATPGFLQELRKIVRKP
jgi:membrane-bound lytic murein transglycosylase B